MVGAAMPNLTYMLAFPDEAARKAAWDTFKADPEWLKLRTMPEYADEGDRLEDHQSHPDPHGVFRDLSGDANNPRCRSRIGPSRADRGHEYTSSLR